VAQASSGFHFKAFASMTALQLLFAAVHCALLRAVVPEPAGACPSGKTEDEGPFSTADLIAEEEDEGSLHLLQRQMRRVKQYREAIKASAASSSDNDFEASGAKHSAVIEQNEESRPSPLAPMVVKSKPTRRRSLDLHFNAVMASCGSKISDPSRCTKAVMQSSRKVFLQLHFQARMDETVPPLTTKEVKSFQDRFLALVVGGSKRVITKSTESERYSSWKSLLQKGYMDMSPIIPESLTKEVNKLSRTGAGSWTAVYDPSFIKMSVKDFKSKLGFILPKEEEEDMKNETLKMVQEDMKQFSTEDLRKAAFSEAFDVRENWPECRNVTTHVRSQTCDNCWSHATALITESRLCIQTHGKFNGPQAWLSQSFIAACRTDGRNYCGAAGGLLGFQTVSRWGVPTGGPDSEGNMLAGVQTCYPQVLPYDTQVRCPGACSPYTKYPRPLSQDLFYVQYEPRRLHSGGSQVPHMVQKALMTEGPILLGMRIYQDFQAYKSGIYKPLRKSYNRKIGGHAVTGMGFGPGYILAINSWGESWGMKGAFQVAPEAVDLGFYLPGRPLGSATGGDSYPIPLPDRL